MKPFLVASFILIFISSSVSAQDYSKKIKSIAELYAEASLKQDVPTEVKYRYIKYVEANGGRDSLIKEIRQEYKSTATFIKLLGFTVGEPGQITRYGTTLFSIVPITTIEEYLSQFPQQKARIKTSLIFLSSDNGNSWSIIRYADLAWLKSVLPDAAKLNVSKPIMLSIENINNNKPSPTQPDTNLHSITINLGADSSKDSQTQYDKGTQTFTINLGKDSSNNMPDQTQTVEKYYLDRRSLALVIVSHNREYLADTNSMKLMVKKGWIKDIIWGGTSDLNPNDTSKYGPDAANGLRIFIIDDKKYPKAYSTISSTMKYVGPFDRKSSDSN